MQSTKSHPATKNLFFILLGQSSSLVFNIISIALVARYLNVVNFGIFNYAIAFVTIFSKIIDFGLAAIVFRETSRVKNDYRLLNSAISFRIVLYLAILILFNCISFIFKISKFETIIFDILFVNIIISAKFQNIRELMDIPFKISLKSYYPMLAILIDNILFLLLVLLVPILRVELIYVVIIYVISNLPGFVFVLLSLYKNYNFKFSFSFYKVKWLIKESLPLLLFVILAVLFQQIDILLLKYLNSEYEAGIYSAAMRLTLPLIIIPSAMINTVFPSLAKNVDVNEIKNQQINKFIIKLLFFISFTISALIGFKANDITILVFGENYFKAYLPVIFLLIMQIFWFYNFFVINVLTAYNKQRKIIAYAFVVLIPNIVLDMMLIPEYSFNGASLAKLISTTLGTLLLFRVMKGEKLKYNFFNLKILFWIIALTGFLFLFSYLNLAFYIVLCIVTILSLTLKLKFFSDEEILLILKLINKEKWSKAILKL